MPKLLAQFSFTFLILAGYLAWQGWRVLNEPGPVATWRVGLYFLAAGIGFGLAMRGLRERHRR